MAKFSKSHIALTAAKDIAEIGKPLTEILHVERFCYHKRFKDGREICFSNEPNWVQFVYQNNLTMGLKLESLEDPNFKSLLWPFADGINGYKQVRDIWDCHYGIDLAIGDNQYFGFASSNKDISAVNHYMNHLEELERFCHFFVEKAEGLIKQASRNMALSFQSPTLQTNNTHETTAAFIAATPISHIQNIKLTNREMDCLKFFPTLSKTST